MTADDDDLFSRIPPRERRLLRLANLLIYAGLTGYAIGIVVIILTLYYGSF